MYFALLTMEFVQRAPKFHQLQIPSGTKFRRPYPSRAKYGGYDTKSIQNGLIWALKWLIYTLFELKSVNIRGVNLIMALFLPELTSFLLFFPGQPVRAFGTLVLSEHIPKHYDTFCSPPLPLVSLG